MEDYRRLWAECLAIIRERINNQERYIIWWRNIKFYSFDEQQNELTVLLPSKFVFYYIEEYHAPLLQEVLNTVFKRNVSLMCKWPQNQPSDAAASDFSQLIDQVAKRGFNVSVKLPQVRVQDAAQRMRDCLQKALGDGYQWTPDYDKVAAWLQDNKGRGLVLVGMSGTGKSVIATRVLPLLVGFENVAVCSAIEMTAHNGKVARIDELLKARCIVIDGLGTEDIEVNHYGRHRRPFIELCDAAEQQGKLLIATTNCLSTLPMPDTWPGKRFFPLSFEERYGSDTFSRLRVIAQSVIFKGHDLRK